MRKTYSILTFFNLSFPFNSTENLVSFVFLLFFTIVSLSNTQKTTRFYSNFFLLLFNGEKSDILLFLTFLSVIFLVKSKFCKSTNQHYIVRNVPFSEIPLKVRCGGFTVHKHLYIY